MVIKILNQYFTEYEEKSQISSFSLKFDYNILKLGKSKKNSSLFFKKT